MKISEPQECRTDHRAGIQPGLYEAMSESDYHRGQGRDALSKSLLVELARSPLHCRQAMESPKESTAAMTFGTACHMALLEPERFRAEYAVFSGDRRTKAGKDAYQKVMASGKTPLSVSDWEAIQGMSRAVHDHPVCRDLLSQGMAEVSLFWKAPIWEVMCKCRCDWLNPHLQTIVDLKTCPDASPGAFGRDAARYRYHWQAHWYTTGAEAVLGPGPWRFVFVAVEKAPPYGVGVYELPVEALDVARRQIQTKHLVSEFWHARELRSWPGYDDQVQILNLPRWALNTEEPYYE
jgi:hypothetical protein